MTRRRQFRLPPVALGLTASLFAVGWGCESSGDAGPRIVPEPPAKLIAPPAPCSIASPDRASRLEQDAWMRAERYPYDPRDGIRGASLFLAAAECYRTVGRSRDAKRVTTTARRLSSRVSTDYAAARVALEHALERKSWRNAQEHVERLLALTEHLNPHPYVQWLRGIAGRTATHDELSR